MIKFWLVVYSKTLKMVSITRLNNRRSFFQDLPDNFQFFMLISISLHILVKRNTSKNVPNIETFWNGVCVIENMKKVKVGQLREWIAPYSGRPFRIVEIHGHHNVKYQYLDQDIPCSWSNRNITKLSTIIEEKSQKFTSLYNKLNEQL